METPQDVKNALAAYCLENDITPRFTNPEQLIDGLEMNIGQETSISSAIDSFVYAPEFSLDGDGYVVQEVMENECGVVVIVGNNYGKYYALSTIDFENEYIDSQTYQSNQIDNLQQDFGHSPELDFPEIIDR